uniref:Cadherin domain-containing protein n=1 Tax=Rhabditophanes sp. KR3021 TaxID=114890 RepID=A0AC35TPE5_9BILA
MSLAENSRGKVIARIDEKIRVGVLIPHQRGKVKFRIVKGIKENQFRTLFKIIGDFAYLHIRQDNNVILNRELTDCFKLTVKAIFIRTGYDNLEATTIVYMNIRDQNDLLARFNDEKPFEYEVSRSIKPFSKIGQVSGFDADEGLNGELLYSFKTFNKYFYIEPLTGIIRNYGNLSSLNGTETFTAFVEDRTSRLFYDNEDVQPQRSAFQTPNEANVVIKVANGEDETKPTKHSKKVANNQKKLISKDSTNLVFSQSYYDINVSEAASVGSFLCSVTNNTSNGNVSYSIISQDNDVKLRIDSEGKIYSIDPFDADATPILHYMLIGIDGLTSSLISVDFTISLIDENDNYPECLSTQSYKALVSEDLPNNSLITCLSGYDKDSGDNGLMSYYLYDEEDKNKFVMDEESGCLFLRSEKPLDYEVQKKYDIKFQILDNGIPRLSTICTLELYLEDVAENLNPPQFENVEIEATIEENMPIGSDVTLIAAKDVDSPSCIPTYKIIDGDGISFFEITESGMIRTLRILDREQKANYFVTVEAFDCDPRNTLSSVVHVIIIISDVNDNYPIIAPINTAYVMENAEENTVICKVEANDADNINDLKSQITYSIVKGNFQSQFGIEEKTGYIIRGKRKFDREAQKEYELHIKACDNGAPQLCSIGVAMVLLKDYNDNYGSVKSNKYNVVVPSGIKGYLHRIVAIDQDSAENRQMNFKMVATESTAMSINEYGEIYSAELLKDREHIKMEVLIEDKLNTAMSVKIELTIKAGNVTAARHLKNKAPEFASYDQWKLVKLSENEKLGQPITVLETIDPDNDVLLWKIEEDDRNMKQYFCITNTGELILMVPVEEINIPLMEFPVSFVVTDGDKSVAGQVIIRKPKNTSYRPQFVSLVYFSEVSEDTQIGSVIFHTSKHIIPIPQDVLITKSPSYGFHMHESVHTIDKLSIDPTNGNVILLEEMDADQLRTFSIVVVVNLNGKLNYTMVKFSILQTKPRSVGEAIGDLAKQNITLPQFENDLYSLTYNKNRDKMFPLLLTTNDAILPFFRLPKKIKECEPYEIHPISGVVSVTSTFTVNKYKFVDFGLCPISFEDVYGRKGRTNVQMRKIDKNSHHPVFPRNVYEGAVYENIPIGSIVYSSHNNTKGTSLSVKAQDEDKGQNGMVTYRMVASSNQFFSVDLFTGIIRTTAIIDREKTPFILAYIYASDMGKPSLVSINPTIINITILDVNDSECKFDKAEEHFDVFKPLARGMYIGQVNATDEDMNSLLQYSLLSNEDSEYFAMNANTGQLMLNKISEAKTEYNLVAICSDSIFTNQMPIKVQFVDRSTNKHYLVNFPLKEYKLKINENMTSTTETARNSLLNFNLSYVHPLVYSLNNEKDKFWIDENSGNLFIKEGIIFDREVTETVELIIDVRSAANPEDFDRTKVEIEINDVNDCNPTFAFDFYDAIVPNDAVIGYKIFSIKATDLDSGLNGMIKYSLVGKIPEFLAINRNDGRISVTKNMSYEYNVGSSFTITVKATDKGTPSLSSTTTILIMVVDKALPIFSHSKYKCKIKENALPTNELTKVRANSYTNGSIGFLLVGGDDYSTFTVNFSNGVIGTRKTLDREVKQQHVLKIAAIDTAKQNISSFAYVEVNVEDVQDSKPKFVKSIYEVYVEESRMVGSVLETIKAFDVDTTPTTIQYRFKEGTKSDKLAIERDTGKVILINSLDFEQKSYYEFEIEAIDDSVYSSEAILILHVNDTNDNPPLIHPTEQINIKRIPDKGQLVTILFVDDKDTTSNLENNQRFFYSIYEGDENLFEIDSLSGVVSFGRKLTAQEIIIQKFTKQLNVSVTDGLFTEYTMFTVHFDMPRKEKSLFKFENSIYSSSLSESNAINTNIIKVKALHGKQPYQYEFIPINTAVFNFPLAIDKKSGEISLADRLDYEMYSNYHVPLKVTDADGAIAFSSLNFTVTNENDCIPKFIYDKAKQIKLHIPANFEEGEFITSILATDDDYKDVLEYTINVDYKDGKYFNIHSKQGLLSLLKSVSGFVEQRLYCQIKVSDIANPPHSTFVDFIFDIVPATAIVPQFSMLKYSFTISKIAPIGTVIGSVEEKEMINKGNDVTYYIDNSREDVPFSIDKASGKVIVKKSLEGYSKQNVISFPIFIMSSEKYTSMATVTVKFLDYSTKIPVFFTLDNEFSIPEDSPMSSVVGIVSATHASTYDIQCVNITTCQFIIDTHTGKILVNDKLDRESVSQYNIVVSANNERGLTTKKTIKIIINDSNTSPPKFIEAQRETFVNMRTLKNEQKLFDFFIEDKDEDSSNNISVHITEGNANNLYYIHQNRSANHIYGFNVLFNGRDKYLADLKDEHLSILVSDGIHFVEKNYQLTYENYPVISKLPNSTYIGVKEDISVDTVIQLLDPNARYTIINSEDDPLPFNFNDKNELTLTSPLNWDDKVFYNFSIKEEIKFISNYYTTNIIDIVVEVINVNHPPRFISNNTLVLSVKENIPANYTHRHFLYHFEAVDIDAPQNSNVTYTLMENRDSLFYLDPTSGIFSLIQPLDKEFMSDFKLTVRAEDKGGRYADFEFEVLIIDINDHIPQFEKELYSVEVLEKSTPTHLLTVHATDQDINDVLSYRIAPTTTDLVARLISIDSQTGQIKLNAPLDFDEIQELVFAIEVSDNNVPPQYGQATVKITCLDINNHFPIFEKEEYIVNMKEHSPLGTKLITIKALDKDSGHYGAIRYSLSGEDAKHFKIDENGTLIVEADLEYKILKTINLNVNAQDGGDPPKVTQSNITINVEAVNNAPSFENCNLTAVIQNGVEKNHILMKINIIDEDEAPNAGPFRLQVIGDGSNEFGFDKEMNLITKRNISHSTKDKYDLQVVAYDAMNMSATCPLTIHLKAQSKHRPSLLPSYSFTLNSIMGEFLGANIGKIEATDLDENDILIYSIPVFNNEAIQGLPIKIAQNTGQLTASSDILERLYTFPVSVTDGKFVENTSVSVDVMSIAESDLSHSLSIRLSQVTPKQFVDSVRGKFVSTLASLFKVDQRNIRIISIQSSDVETFGRSKRQSEIKHRHQKKTDLDILVAIYSSKIKDHLRPEFVMKRLEQSLASQSNELPFEIAFMNHDVCSESTCNDGTCEVKVWLDNQNYNTVSGESGSIFVTPYHARTFICRCKEGFGGRRCEISVNKCSHRKCNRNEMCIPSYNDLNQTDFDCSCLHGLQGTNCNEKKVCKTEESCSEYNAISTSKNGYFQMHIGKSIEQRLNLVFDFKTISNNGTLFSSSGISDYNSLVVENGNLKYSWECGTGKGQAIITKKKVSDGKWHKVKIYRVGRQATIKLDDEFSSQAYSKSGSDVINLYDNSNILTFGASLKYYSNATSIFDMIYDSSKSSALLTPIIIDSIVACFGKVLIDDQEQLKTMEGLKVHNVKIGCEDSFLGPCVNANCLNGGICQAEIGNGRGDYTCECPNNRFTGQNCEIDSNMCQSQPCPAGVVCHNLINDFYCGCPTGFTGKTCHVRGTWDPCSSKPCGDHGNCISIQSDWYCNCSGGYSGKYCTNRYPQIIPDSWSALTTYDFILILILILVATIAIICSLYVCKKNKKANKATVYNELSTNANDNSQMSSQLLGKGVVSHDNQRITLDFNSPHVHPYPQTSGRSSIATSNNNHNISAPPLPPRYFKSRMASNCDLYQNDLPTVSVRPMQAMVGLGSRELDLISHASSHMSKDWSKMSPNNGRRRNQGSPRNNLMDESIQCLQTDSNKSGLDLPLYHSDIKQHFEDEYVIYGGNKGGGDYMTMKPKPKLRVEDIDEYDESEPLNEDVMVESVLESPPPVPIHRFHTIDKKKEIDDEHMYYDSPIVEN